MFDQRRKILRALAAGAAAPTLAGPAIAIAADNYPSKPLRIVVPFPPGGGTDLLSRYMAAKLGAELKQSIIVENRAGAGGTIGAEYVVRSTPDGYTLSFCTPSYAVNAKYYNISYDPVHDVSPVSFVADSPLLATVNPKLPIHSVQDLIAYAHAHPNTLNYASSGNGSIIHIATELFKQMANIQMMHVPYKGTIPGLTDVIEGRVQVIFGDIVSTLPMAKAGKVRAIAVTTAQRIAGLPDLPTIAESGVPGYEVSNWYGIFGPAKMPSDIVNRLNEKIRIVLESPDTKQRFVEQGLIAHPTSPGGFGEILSRDIAKFAKVGALAHLGKAD